MEAAWGVWLTSLVCQQLAEVEQALPQRRICVGSCLRLWAFSCMTAPAAQYGLAACCCAAKLLAVCWRNLAADSAG